MTKKKYLEKLKSNLQISPTEIDKIKGLIQIKEIEKERIQNDLSRFNFYINEKNIDTELVYEIEDKISKLNTVRYRLETEIKDLNSSIEKDISFDLNSTMQIFKEVGIYFPNQLRKSYEDLIAFNKTLTVDRNKYIVTTLETKKSEIRQIQIELENLNSKRSELLQILRETDTFKKYQYLEKNLSM